MDCRSAKKDFNLLTEKLPASVLSNFVGWLDLKVAEYKVFGRLLSDAEAAKQKHDIVVNGNKLSYIPQIMVKETLETDGSEIINLDSDNEDLEYESQKQVLSDNHKITSLDHLNKQINNDSVSMNITTIKVEPDDGNRPELEVEMDILDDKFVHECGKDVPGKLQILSRSDSKKGNHGNLDRSEVKELKLELENAYQDHDKLKNHSCTQHFLGKGQEKQFMSEGQGYLMSGRQTTLSSDKPFVDEIQNIKSNELSRSEIHIEDTDVHVHLLKNLKEMSAISDGNRDNTFSSLSPSPSQRNIYFEANQEMSPIEHKSYTDYHDDQEESLFSRLAEQGQGQNGEDHESDSGNHGDRSVNDDIFDIQFPETEPSSLKMCNICFSIFSNITELQKHFSTCHPEDSLYPGCVFCGNSFQNDSILKRHIACDHMRSNIGFQCIFCGKEFSQAQHFKGHLNQHRGVRPFKCKRCGKSYTYKTHLTCHMRSCGGINGQHKCNLCHRVFLTRSYLSQHMNGMHGNPRYKCEFCGDKFVWRGSLNHHKKLKCKSNPARQ